MSCPDCFKGSVHTHAEPKGHMETLYGYSTYVSPAPEGSTSKSTIFFICDAFGLNLVNNVSMINLQSRVNTWLHAQLHTLVFTVAHLTRLNKSCR